MNFKKLQEMQRALDNAILKEKPEMTAEERFEKTCVALSVEVAELANTAEHFKFWKENKGKVDGKRFIITPGIVNKIIDSDYYDKSTAKYVATEQAHKLTLVEEASDVIHFILSLANQLGWSLTIDHNPTKKLDNRYLLLQKLIDDIDFQRSGCEVQVFMDNFMGYISRLGIDTQELEQAYYDKNEINYQRLEQGY